MHNLIYEDHHGNKIFSTGKQQLHFPINGLQITFGNATNNVIEICDGSQFNNVRFDLGNDRTCIKIGQNCQISNTYIRLKYGYMQLVSIGDNTIIHGADFFLDENSGCVIGDNCLISDSVKFWGSDGHAIIDLQTNQVINSVSGPITIGQHTWIGQAVRITKNARVARNSIIGMASVVTKAFTEENVILVGQPAKIVKRDVNWDFRSPFLLTINSYLF